MLPLSHQVKSSKGKSLTGGGVWENQSHAAGGAEFNVTSHANHLVTFDHLPLSSTQRKHPSRFNNQIIMSTPASDALFDELDKPLIVYVLVRGRALSCSARA